VACLHAVLAAFDGVVSGTSKRHSSAHAKCKNSTGNQGFCSKSHSFLQLKVFDVQ
jgi:formylmethanofuran:tetrahydromethanopterin formyltransferase